MQEIGAGSFYCSERTFKNEHGVSYTARKSISGAYCPKVLRSSLAIFCCCCSFNSLKVSQREFLVVSNLLKIIHLNC